MLRVLTRILVDAFVVAGALFVAAGTLAWPRAWVLLAMLVVVRTLSAIAVFRVNPTLLRERATVLIHQDQPLIDRLVLFAFMISGFIGVPAVAALDAFHWHVLPSPPRLLASGGIALFTMGWTIIGMALRENSFAVTVVRHQLDRQHAVVASGLYGVVRHPMYAGNLLVNVGLGLWLGSYAAVLFAVIPFGLLMVRIAMEEHFLRRELPGYHEYAAHVAYRLLPGVW